MNQHYKAHLLLSQTCHRKLVTRRKNAETLNIVVQPMEIVQVAKRC